MSGLHNHTRGKRQEAIHQRRAKPEVRIGYNSVYVPVMMYGDPRYPLQQIPDVEQNSPYNHFGIRKQDDKRVMILIKRDVAKQKQRQQTSEYPFGTLKRTDGYAQIRRNGLI